MVDLNKSLWFDDGTGPVRHPDLTEEEFQQGLLDLQAQNVAALWQAAHDYQCSQISEAAYVLLTIGVLKQLPKSLAVMAWVQSIWTLYYTRKPQITHEYPAALLDFSSCGKIPHSTPDLMAEVGGA